MMDVQSYFAVQSNRNIQSTASSFSGGAAAALNR
jgi:hypothetical protein